MLPGNGQPVQRDARRRQRRAAGPVRANTGNVDAGLRAAARRALRDVQRCRTTRTCRSALNVRSRTFPRTGGDVFCDSQTVTGMPENGHALSACRPRQVRVVYYESSTPMVAASTATSRRRRRPDRVEGGRSSRYGCSGCGGTARLGRLRPGASDRRSWRRWTRAAGSWR